MKIVKYLSIICLSFILFMSGIIFYNYNNAKKTLDNYFTYVHNLDFDKANILLKKKRRYPDIPQKAKYILKLVTKRSKYKVKLKEIKGIHKFSFEVSESNPLVFDIIKNYKKESNTKLEDLDIKIFNKYLDNILLYDEYYDQSKAIFLIEKNSSSWIINIKK
jgi:hypothetical protein